MLLQFEQRVATLVTLNANTLAIVPNFVPDDLNVKGMMLLDLRRIGQFPANNGVAAATQANRLIALELSDPAKMDAVKLGFLLKTITYPDWLPVQIPFNTWADWAMAKTLPQFNSVIASAFVAGGVPAPGGPTPAPDPTTIVAPPAVKAAFDSIFNYWRVKSRNATADVVSNLYAKRATSLSIADWQDFEKYATEKNGVVTDGKLNAVLVRLLAGDSFARAVSLSVDTGGGNLPGGNNDPKPDPKTPLSDTLKKEWDGLGVLGKIGLGVGVLGIGFQLLRRFKNGK